MIKRGSYVDKKFPIQLGKLIKKHRLKKALTQAKLGELVGFYDRSTICAYEHGRKVPTLETGLKIIKVLDISLLKWEKCL